MAGAAPPLPAAAELGGAAPPPALRPPAPLMVPVHPAATTSANNDATLAPNPANASLPVT
jgi:hypothetical protein